MAVACRGLNIMIGHSKANIRGQNEIHEDCLFLSLELEPESADWGT